jgi:branched-subunit amino acid transport protein
MPPWVGRLIVGMTPGELLIILGMAVAVFAPKALPLTVVSEGLTTRLRVWLQYVAPAVLGALVAPSIIAPTGKLAAPGWDQSAYVVAFVVALCTRRMVPSLAAGLATVLAVAVIHP